MKNKIVFIILLFAALFMIPCYGQGKRKKKEPEMPKELLYPQVQPQYFEEQLDKFVKEWICKFQFPANAKSFKANFRDCQHLTPGAIQQGLLGFRNIAMHPDLEEVTRLPRSWYIEIFNAALPLEQASKKLLNVSLIPSEQKFQESKAMFIAAATKVLAIYEKKPKKIAKEKYEEICAKNKARRKKEWLENYKKQQAELAKKRAAKKNKVRKNDEKESEE